jgi:hypothetical protein
MYNAWQCHLKKKQVGVHLSKNGPKKKINLVGIEVFSKLFKSVKIWARSSTVFCQSPGILCSYPLTKNVC